MKMIAYDVNKMSHRISEKQRCRNKEIYFRGKDVSDLVLVCSSSCQTLMRIKPIMVTLINSFTL